MYVGGPGPGQGPQSGQVLMQRSWAVHMHAKIKIRICMAAIGYMYISNYSKRRSFRSVCYLEVKLY